MAKNNITNKAILIILDGFGIRKEKRGNAIALAKKPFFDYLWKKYPHTELRASGEAVGLPKGYIGNSEVGHTHLGSGRIIKQDLSRINDSIKDGSFFKNKVLTNAMKHIKKTNTTLHLMGLISDAGVHSHINHLFALLKLAKKYKIKKCYIHCFLDGRDVPQKSAKRYIRMLIKETKKLGIGKIATIMGRYYAMDRDNRWNREHKAYDAMVNGNGRKINNTIKAINYAYSKNETDEFIKPTIIDKNGMVKENDTIIFFNFRSDRARQITSAFVLGKFNKFKRKRLINLNFISLTEYDEKIPTKVVFPPVKVKNILGEVISKHGLKQFRIAETEKYAHVTYFFNSGREHPFKGEEREIIPSPKVSTYDLRPEMSAHKIAKEVIKAIKKNRYSLIVINFANPDMVGHTGKLKPTIKAIETVDRCLRDVVNESIKNKYNIIITADHGNAEEMIGKHRTSHTTNKVPFILITEKKYKIKKQKNQGITKVAPTILKLLKIKKPKEMENALI